MEIAPFFVGFWLVPLGAYLIYINRKVKAKIAEARLWPQAKGRMVKIERTGLGSKIVGSDDYRQYRLDMQYEYDVEGETYKGERVVFGAALLVKDEVDAACKKFPEGDDLMVYYNSQQHDECVLLLDHPGGKNDAIKYVGYVLTVVGIGLLIFNSGWFL
ncbi:MAG: hypothetical protein COB36_02120 [Alphaproteobacteria bacterium]|nr:MAG: hypothetical protein COB36_02120 [Alphaproteobacteria bacterium]